MRRKVLLAAALAATAAAWAGCGGGSPLPINPPPPVVNNTVPVQVTLGPTGDYVNGLFVSVTICAPGTAQCDTIPNVLVDTGSFGLRILASQTTLNYPQINDGNGNPLGNCGTFADSFVWGPVVAADVILGNEKASSVPIQLIGQGAINGNANFPVPPGACTNSGLPPNDTVQSLGANGILGIGVFRHDCGAGCAPGGASPIPPVYFSCPSTGCTATYVDLTDQLQNPIWLFPQDNNGVMVSLPSIPAQGDTTSAGTLTFGIGTQTDNGLGTAQVFTVDSNGEMTTTFNTTSVPSVIDTGSNLLFFLDSTTTGLPLCSSNNAFYCPTSTANLSATNIGAAKETGPVNFSIGDAETLFSSGNAAFNDVGGPSAGSFDWGMPFFFGRKVFFAINTLQTPVGPGPYFAY